MKVFRTHLKPDGSRSNVGAIGFDPSTKTLRVYFQKPDGTLGGIYQYVGVPSAFLGELLFADSVGKWFIANIKSQYNHREILGEEKAEALADLAQEVSLHTVATEPLVS